MGKSNTIDSYKPQQYKTQYAPKKKVGGENHTFDYGVDFT
jgi:hypothetical protein